MNKETPISLIRKAVNGIAEDMASKEFLQKPESRHYEATFENLRTIKSLNAEMLEKVLIMAAKAKDLKTILGKELDLIFEKVWDEINLKNKDKILKSIEDVSQRNDLNQEELDIEVSKLTKKGFEEIGNQIKSDHRIISAFLGKEEILNQAINFVKSEFPKLF